MKTPYINCKQCGKEKKLKANRDFNPNGNFCSQGCHHQWSKDHAQPEDIKRDKWNKYQSKYRRDKTAEKRRIKQESKSKDILNKIISKFINELFEPVKEKRVPKTPEQILKIREARKYWWNKLCKPSSKGISKQAFERIKAQHEYKCALCGQPEPFLNQYWQYLTQDHIIPRSLGGRKRSATNIQPACWDCNIKKSNKLVLA